MKIITGNALDGRIAVEGQPFAEGQKTGTLGLSSAEKQQLRESIAQADRGEFVDAEQLLSELDESNRRS